ncbi:unnamed protein product [Dovyalis caffra]|uniref:Cytochrome P450 n=1 Tax=Dovyalis caffra TaxID=77055 RepID=A0AAV1RP77_9ROSI|nr:unnamed protein product [Dovyalis caffra]
MDQTSFAGLLNLLSNHFLLFLLLPLIFFIILKYISSPSSPSKSLPPGPKPWPIIGNILHMGNQPHLSLAKLAKIHGPIISLRLGIQLLVVGSSPEAAVEILRTHDRLLSARHIPKQFPYESHVLNHIALIWSSECTERWKWLRALCKAELFSAKAMESHAPLREKKVGEMVEFLGAREGETVEIAEVVFNTVFNMLSNLLFSKDLAGLEEKGVLGSGLKSHIRKMIMLLATPYIANFYPVFAGLDLQGLKRSSTIV